MDIFSQRIFGFSNPRSHGYNLGVVLKGIFSILVSTGAYASPMDFYDPSFSRQCVSAYAESIEITREFLQTRPNLPVPRLIAEPIKFDAETIDELIQGIQYRRGPLEYIVTETVIPGYLRPFEKLIREKAPRLYRAAFSLAFQAKDSAPINLRALEAVVKGPSRSEGLLFLDAHRHGVWSALLTDTLGPELALCVLVLHEVDSADGGIDMKNGTNGYDERVMDFINNHFGVELALKYPDRNKSFYVHAVQKLILEGPMVVIDPDAGTVNYARDLIRGTIEADLLR